MKEINEMTVKEATEYKLKIEGELKCLNEIFNSSSDIKTNSKSIFIDKYVIVRCVYAGNWAGVLIEKKGDQVVLKDARRLCRWKAKKSISLSAVAEYGIDDDKSKICPKHQKIELNGAIEVIPTSDISMVSIQEAKEVEQNE